MIVKPAQADAFCRAPDAAVRVVLLHGPDRGAIGERADLLVTAAAGDMRDPFRTALLAGDAAAAEPALLSDEAAQLALAGGRRAVRVKDATDRLADAVKTLLARPSGDTLVVIEAGELPARSRLRTLLEGAREGAALACYRDEGRALAAFVTREMERHGVAVEREALALLTAWLGGDRRQTRAEIAKLALYVGAGGRAGVADVEAAVADSSFLSAEKIAHAAAAGRMGELERSLERALAQGEQPLAILLAVRRHMTQLQLVLARRERGETLGNALKAARILHFRAADAIKAAAPRWNVRRTAAALARLTETEIRCKTTGMPAAALCRRALFELACRARAG